MGMLREITWIVLLLGLLAVAGLVTGEVDWTDEVTDPADDVEDTEGTVMDFPGADILSVSIAEDGDDINVTMVLAGEYNSSGTYTISVSVDGSDDTYDFTRMFFLGFSVSDPSGDMVDMDGYYSADGKTISWVVAKADIAATTSFEIEMAMSMVMDITGGGPTVMDYAGMGTIPTEMPVPDSMEMVLSMPKLHILQMKVTITFKGEDADTYRMMIDSDSDGTVTQTEVDSFLDDIMDDEDMNASEANVTLDGEDPTDMDSDYTIEGAKGAVESGADFKMVMTMKLTFPKPEDKDTHEIAFKEPFGEDFIGGDEPWENEFDMTIKLQAPDDWTLKGDSIPETMKDYLNEDGDEVSMDAEDIEKDWNNTFADLRKFTIEKKDEGPGFGLVIAVTAATVAAFVVRRRR
jgi:PGF-CTERM protein